MNTINKVFVNAWVEGSALNAAMNDAESRYAAPSAYGVPRRWVYAHNGRQLASTDLFGPIVIEVEADTQNVWKFERERR